MPLNPGDLMFVGYDADNEDIAFVTTVDLAPGEVIYFTDDEWNGTQFNSNEQLIEWVVPAGGIPAGTLVEVDMVANGGASSASFTIGGNASGTVDYIRGGGQLATQNEMFWAFQGTRVGDDVTPTNFIGVIANEADGGNNQTPNLSGTGLTTSNGAIIIDGDEDYMEYIAENSLSQPVVRQEWIDSISDLGNWETEDGNGNSNPNGVGFDLTFPPVCFTIGTLIQTPKGAVLIETLKPGDLVQTLDHGPQVLRWIGQRTVPALGKFAPICFSKGALDNTRDLLVSPQHRMLITGWNAQLLFGTSEVLVPATALVNDTTIRRQTGGLVTYVHILFDQHEIVLAEGIPSESFFPGEVALNNLDDHAREEILTLFPELTAQRDTFAHTARLSPRIREARALQVFIH